MNPNIWLAMITLTLGAIVVTGSACPADECEDGEQRCASEQVESCVGGVWGAAEDCPEAQGCMTMDSGVEHCMAAM